MASSLPAFSKLHHTNYTIWAGDMEAWLRSQGLSGGLFLALQNPLPLPFIQPLHSPFLELNPAPLLSLL